MKSAAIFAALFLCAGTSLADGITLSSPSGGLKLQGRFVAYDGRFVQVETDYGVLSVDYATVKCEGADCPNSENYVPRFRVSGAARMAELLLPALVDGYARSRGWTSQIIPNDPSHFQIELVDADRRIAGFSFRIGSSAEGFADLIAHETDIALSLRPVRREEVARGVEVGLGQLDNARQAIIVGLDALVPVVWSGQTVSQISLSDLADTFAGRISNWSDLGGSDGPIALHVLAQNDGQIESFEDRVLAVAGRKLSDRLTLHNSLDALAAAVSDDPQALGLLPFNEVGNGRALSLVDNCGFVASPRMTTLKTQDYPLTTPLFLYFPHRHVHPELRAFLSWLNGPQAQLVIRRAGFVDQGAVPIPLDAQGQRFANAISAAGEDMPLIELQRMVRVLAPRVRLSTSFRFEVGSTRLDAQSRSNLLSLGQAILDGRFDDQSLMLVGFSDGRGSSAANRDLASARAESVRRALLVAVGGSVPTGVVVETEAFGEALPMGCDDTEWGRQINRRVELWVSQ